MTFKYKLALTLCVVVAYFAQSFSGLLTDEEYADINFDEESSVERARMERAAELTPKELELANQAKARIAKAIQDNLIRLLAILSVEEKEKPRGSRQEDPVDPAGMVEEVQPDPSYAPQISQLVGALLSGSFNVSGVVERTYGLVPNILRNQVGGLVKLLAEQAEAERNRNRVNRTSPSTSNTRRTSTTQTTLISFPGKAATPEPTTTEEAPASTSTRKTVSGSGFISIPVAETPGGSHFPESAQPPIRPRKIRKLNETEIQKLEEILRTEGKKYAEYYTEHKPEPRGILDDLVKVLGGTDLNSTAVTGNLGSMFKGAGTAIQTLNSLGLWEPITDFIQYELEFLATD